MPKKFPKMLVHDESINTYGSRVITEGWKNKEAFFKNPIMLYDHREDLVIGYWEDIEVKANGEIWARPVFDMADKFAAKIAGKFERKFIKAASLGIRMLKVSKASKYVLTDQTLPSVVEWEMREISITPIGSNKNAVALYDKEDNVLNLSDLTISENQNKISKTMEENTQLQVIAGFVGLRADASLTEIQSKIMEFRNKAEETEALKKQLSDIHKKEADRKKAVALVTLNDAIKNGLIREDQKDFYQNFAETQPGQFEALVKTMKPTVNLHDIPNRSGGNQGGELEKFEGKTFSELSKDNPNKLAQLKEKNPDTFKALYKSEFGKDWKD